MLTANNLIFDSTVAANGAWRNISNFPSFSIHLKNVEGHVWIEVSNDPDCMKDDTMVGVNVTSSGASNDIIGAATGNTDEDQLIYNAATKQAIWSPSCLVYNYIRVCKDNTAQTLETKAFLFGQQG